MTHVPKFNVPARRPDPQGKQKVEELRQSSGKKQTSIRRSRIYFFRKSGNLVQAIEPTTYGGRGNWVVRRTDGASAGKELIVPGHALVTRMD